MSLPLLLLSWIPYALPWTLYTHGSLITTEPLQRIEGAFRFALVAVGVPMLVIFPMLYLAIPRAAGRMRGAEARDRARSVVVAGGKAYLLYTVPAVLMAIVHGQWSRGTHTWVPYAVVTVVAVGLAWLTWPVWKKLER